MPEIDTARTVISHILDVVPSTTLSRTTYCALVVLRPDGSEVVYVAEAGATASGISGPLLDSIQNSVDVNTQIIVGSASTETGLGTWHMNDAEQQALRIASDHISNSPSMLGSVLKAIKANRDICDSCTHTLRSLYGMTINGSEATA